MHKLWINFAVKMNVVCLVESDIGNRQFFFQIKNKDGGEAKDTEQNFNNKIP